MRLGVSIRVVFYRIRNKDSSIQRYQLVSITAMALVPQSTNSRLYKGLKRTTAALTGTLTIALSLFANPALAGDPFRTENPRAIGDRTEAAFKSMFEQGNYVEAAALLQQAETDEPLAYALKASLAYINEDLNGLGQNARLTRETAEQLKATDPLRGHLYTAAGLFLEGAHTFLSDGAVRSTPTVLANLQQVFNQLREAERIDPNDPELNLLKGYMDLILAVNLPFANPDQAIQRLNDYARPSYLAQRGIALGYRDLDQQQQALEAVDRALAETPNNPELFYLKAQILRRMSDDMEGDQQKQLRRQSLVLFRQAWAQRTQLPEPTVEQIDREACRTFQYLRDRDPNVCGDRAINWQREQQASGS
jgi:tetratricopeptide (TPR) repeat protein